jgi:tetratricopeptide (TPR) repeat protein
MNQLPQRALPIAVLLCALATAGLQSGQQVNRKPEQKSAASQTNARVNTIRENNFGVALMSRQMFQKALEKFRSVCADKAQAGLGCLNAGIALLNLQRQQDARMELLAYANKHPESPRVWYNLGLLERKEGNFDSAIKDFQTTARLDPRDADTRYFIGLLELQSQHYDLAIAAFESAIQLNPFHASAEFGLAQASERSGLTEQAREHLLRFQHITATKLGAPIGSAYGEEGNYSLAEEMAPAPEPVPPAIPVHFVDVTSTSGLPIPASPPIPSRSLAGFLGSAACVFDYDGDGLPDILLVNSDGNGDLALYRNLGNGRFQDVTRKAKIRFHGEGTGCAVGDYDNDGHPDFAIGSSQGVVLFHNQGDGTFRDVTNAVGIHTKGLVLGLTFIDFDHDGDLDLYVDRFGDSLPWNPQDPLSLPQNITPAGNVLWRNNGNGTFTDWTQATGLGGSAPSVSAIGSDVNNDRATDFVLTGWTDAPAVFLNQREGPFQPVIPWATAMPGPTAGVVALDFDKDDWMDLAFTHWSTPGLSLWRNVGGKSFERVPLPDLGWRRGWGVAALDYDNDGWVDLVAVGEDSSGAGRITLLRNEGALGFRDVTHETGLDKVVLRNPRSVIPFDYDQDGTADLLITQNGLPPVLLRNLGGNKNHWLKLAFKGTIDNKTSIGTKVQVFAGPQRQKWEVGGASGYLGQGPTQILAGLGIETSADVVRLLWPTGVLQDELEIPAQQPRLITEIERRGSSCPILFVWNGKRFQFLADIIGPGIVGHWVGPTERNIPNPEEYLKVPGSDVAAKNGLIQFRMLEPMEELDYLDRVRLLAIDHPADIEVYPNEYFANKPPFPKFKVIASRDARPPQGAWDDSGRDVLSLLLQRDRQYVTNFRLAPYAGFAVMHSLILDLGRWNPHRPLRLLMDGFTDYFSANSMHAAWKAGVQPVPPYVEALDSSRKWVHILDDMGFPAGLARTMVADLTGRVPPGTRLIRITTNLRIYWDRIRVDNSPEDLPFVVVEAPLAEARLAFRGYPRVMEGNPRNDIQYVYEDVSATGPYARQIGNYTRYGEVTDLVRSPDEEYVIFGSGDEVAVDFDARRVPVLPSDWLRDYFFYADGFAKDMDFYAAFGDTVSPLPFHTSIPFPYPDGIGYPLDDQHLKYLLEYSTRGVLGPAGPSFRFSYSDTRR